MPDIDKIVEGFPHPTITPIIGIPTYESISEIHIKLNSNAASVHSELGNGALGLLALTVTPAVHNTLAGVPYVTAVNPGQMVTIPPGSTGPQIAALDAAHKTQVRIWKEYLSVDKALKQQLLGCVNEMYYRTLRNRHTGYAIVSTRDIITHLYTQYGNITPQDLQENDLKIKTPFDTSLPIETLYDQIEDAVELADAGSTPYSAQQVVAIAYSLVFATGQLTEACRDWKRSLAGHKTWSNFKIDFGLAFKELRESQQTAQGAGFVPQNANHAALVEGYAAETAEAIENLANAAVQNQVTVQALTNTNTNITQNLMEANQQLAKALSRIAALQVQGG